ncbi:Oligopeptide transport ATP-binding protein OppD [Clostridiaceae bacterium JG1575]|nr:Oligopeptide transport ATP-binding protein OppD [Clostridiaceae bacterium JG1575]
MDLLTTQKLCIGRSRQQTPIVRSLDLRIAPGEFVSLIGESGSGKTLTSLALAGILPPKIQVLSGEILWKGRPLSAKGSAPTAGIAMVFQDAMTALNPLMKVGHQISEAITKDARPCYRDHRKDVLETLEQVGLAPPEQIYESYPHELSGGMRQRIALAMAVVARPELLILDEPTTALDVTIQAQVLELVERLRRELNLAVLLISHDLGVVHQYADRVYLLYQGTLMEEAPKQRLFAQPHHPYTKGLLAAIRSVAQKKRPFAKLLGHPGAILEGCRFQGRCPYVMDRCLTEEPAYHEVGPSLVRCHLMEGRDA